MGDHSPLKAILLPRTGKLKLCLLGLGFLFFVPACASAPPNVQPQVNSLIVANKAEKALAMMDSIKDAYGKNNELLFDLDKALVLHLAKNYTDSIQFFEKAKSKFDELYTQSISQGVATWVINDYSAPYHGEDFEHVLVNIFQALNYTALNNLSEALVEARQVDLKLSLIDSQYPPQQKNVYKEDAFARLLMGILYEANGTPEDYNDAFISYKKAEEIYREDYSQNYHVDVPLILKENILAAAQWMGQNDFAEYHARYPDVPLVRIADKKKKGQIYLIQYNGLAAIKTQYSLPIPLPGGIITRLAFPAYHERFCETKTSKFSAKDLKGGRLVHHDDMGAESEIAEDISRIGIQNLENRKLRVLAKAIARPIGKYVVEHTGEQMIQKRYGDNSAVGFQIAASLFNLYSEQADLRSWQTLPAEIRVTRLMLDPGEYELSLDNFDQDHVPVDRLNLGKMTIATGDVKFLIVRTVR